MDAVLELTDRLEAELPQMLAEHRSIVQALEVLAHAAHEAGREAYAAFADELVLHAQTEEEIMYPAALLVGDLVRARQVHEVARRMILP